VKHKFAQEIEGGVFLITSQENTNTFFLYSSGRYNQYLETSQMKQKRLLIIFSVLFLTLGLLAVVAINAGTAMSAGFDRLRGDSGGSNANPPAAAMGEEVQDGGFEGGTPNAAWAEASTNFGTPLCNAAGCGLGGGTGPHAGAWWAWFGGIAAAEEGSVSQNVMIPAGTTTLTWWQECPVTSGAAADYLEVNIDGNQEYQILGNDASCGVVGYAQQSIDISAYADGGSHLLEFHSQIFGTGTTNFFVDDVSIISPDALPGIVLTKTVGVVPGVCATTSTIIVPGAGADVYYCYEVMNTGNVTLTLHDLVDDQLGQLLTGEPFSLAPGDLYDTVTGGFEFSATITQTTVNSATWTAFNNSQETASASASALVDVSSTPTSVSLTGFGDGGPASTPFLFGALALFVVGLGFAMRRKFTD
jgi:MYXO-CTERM domain-containing protein